MVGLRNPAPPAKAPPKDSAGTAEPQRVAGRWQLALGLGAAVIAGLVLPREIALEPGSQTPPFERAAAQPLAAQGPEAAEPDADDVRGFVHALPPAVVPALLPTVPAPLPREEPAWRRNAVAVADPQGRPMIAIVIDDLGLDRRNADRVVRLPGPLTLAFMTYANDLAAQTEAAHAAGHELLVHVPMEPLDGQLNAGPNVLRPDLPPEELRRRIDWALSRFDGYVGINNHMGSRFTADAPGMAELFAELHRRGLLFLDSRTTAATVGGATAVRYDVPFATRNVFLDNDVATEAVWAQLTKTEADARRTGFAVAIGHPHDGTIAALAAWLPTLSQRGFALVPVSRIVERNLAARGQAVSYQAVGPVSDAPPPIGSSFR
jgi:polysaccharide deacetylase 2 family uncharacterized protein YibQ